MYIIYKFYQYLYYKYIYNIYMCWGRGSKSPIGTLEGSP